MKVLTSNVKPYPKPTLVFRFGIVVTYSYDENKRLVYRR